MGKSVIYFIFLLCGILSQGICSLYEENNEKSSGIHIRQKRITGGTRRPHEDARFLVSILNNENYHCPASLLSNDVAITSAQCCKTRRSPRFSIQSLAIRGPNIHPVERVIFLDPNYNVSHPTVNNLALLKFSPPINYHDSSNRAINIFSRNLAIQDLQVDVVTWAKPLQNGRRLLTSAFIRSLAVRLVSIHYCQDIYRGLVGIGHICAYAATPGEHCENADTGAALTVEGELLGIMVFHGDHIRPIPEVFMNLLDHDIKRWIHEHVPSLRLF